MVRKLHTLSLKGFDIYNVLSMGLEVHKLGE